MDKLTIEERIDLLIGDGFWHTKSLNGKLERLHLSDGPHGLRKQDDGKKNNDSIPSTCFPTASALSCSFDRDMISKVAGAIAMEAFNENVSVLLGPGINMKRSPLAGRNFEYFSEDPYLSGELGIAYVKAVEEKEVSSCLKHFAMNNQETRRLASNSMVDEKAMREIYLRAFEKTVKEGRPSSIMASYNKINGAYATENKFLLNDVLRGEWGFDGIVISDWGASTNLTKSIDAGMDLEMPSSGKVHTKKLTSDLKTGVIGENKIIESSDRLLRFIDRFSMGNRKRKEPYDISRNHEISVTAAEKSAVLLKNDGILPLKEENILVIGGLAKDVRFQGGGSSHINATRVKNAIDALESVGYSVTYAEGYRTTDREVDDKLLLDAIKAAREAKTILFFEGLTDLAEGEGFDRESFELPMNQIHLIEEVLKVNDNVVFISFGGSPYDMSPLDGGKAILDMHLSGEGVMEAMAEIVSGKVNPSGKLSETIPYGIEDVPSFGSFALDSNNCPYKESIFIGYRYYDTFGVDVRYPFGFGLSYTRFSYDNLKIERDGNDLTISLDVRNEGEMAGEEIVEIFVSPKREDYLRPKRELKGFAKVPLGKGETKRVSIRLDEDTFREYDIKKGWITVEDDYLIEASASINDVRLSGVVHIEGEEPTDERAIFPEYFDKKRKLKNITDTEFKKIYGKEMIDLDNPKVGEFTISNSLKECARYSLKAKFLLWLARKVVYHDFKDKRKDDPEVMMVIKMMEDGTLDCVALQGGIPYRIMESIVLSCNKKRFKALIKLITG